MWLPVIVGCNVRLGQLHRGCIKCEKKTGVIAFGVREGSFGMHTGITSFLNIGNKGVIIFAGKAMFQNTFHLNVNSQVRIGKEFSSNSGFLLSSENSVSIGDECLLGWNVTIIDGDGHSIFRNFIKTNYSMPIVIGHHCWIAANSAILKGVQLADNTVVPYGSIINKSNQERNVIFKNKVLRDSITWKM